MGRSNLQKEKICKICKKIFRVSPSKLLVQFCSRQCSGFSRRGKFFKKDGQHGMNNPNWKGGRKIRGDGYVQIYFPAHPTAIKGYVYEHRLFVEKILGRYLKRKEHIHHIDGNPSNNKIDNLMYFRHTNAHHRIHNFCERHNISLLLIKIDWQNLYGKIN